MITRKRVLIPQSGGSGGGEGAGKATWNLGLGGALTTSNIVKCPYYTVKVAGTLFACTADSRIPGSGTLILTASRSRDWGASWVEVLPSDSGSKIILSAGALVPHVELSEFASPPADSLQVGDLLRVEISVTSSQDWQSVAVVLEWR